MIIKIQKITNKIIKGMWPALFDALVYANLDVTFVIS